MQVLREKPDYELPDDFGCISSLLVQNPDGYHVRIMHVSAPELSRMRDKDDVLGIPRYASVYDDRIWFHPTPDADYNILARYTPADKTW